ncbi:MAG: hypothetical protein JO023_09710 [Chloroflexi bacterium]|nr:hypothetical protein [Chloroflexota bacterium]
MTFGGRGWPVGLGALLAVLVLGCQAAPSSPAAPAPTVRATVPGPTPVAPPGTPTATVPPEPAATLEPTMVLNLPSGSAEPVAVAVHFDALMNAGDVEGTLALFNPDAQVKVPPDFYTTPLQIRDWVSYLATNHYASEPGLRKLNGDTVTWSAEVRSDQLQRFGVGAVNGDATLVVRGDHILAYTFVLTQDSAVALREARLRASEVLQDPLVVGQDNANVYGQRDVFRTADGTLVSYRDVVGAESGSGPFYDLGGQPVTIRTGI